MDKKRNRKNKRHFTERAGRRLAPWARKRASGGISDDELDRMEALIEKYVDSGQDDVFRKAFSLLENDPEAFLALEEAIDVVSETLKVALSAGNESAAGNLVLFAVPIVLGVEPGAAVPGSLPEAAFDAVLRSFRQAGMWGLRIPSRCPPF